jgi:CheY-like chemotaxis protein/HPt (histidine-containing phosphotransfer) domain-containing protein
MSTTLIIGPVPEDACAALPAGETLVRVANVPAALAWLARNSGPERLAVLIAAGLPGIGPGALARAARCLPGRTELPVVVINATAQAAVAGCTCWHPADGGDRLRALHAGLVPSMPTPTPLPAVPAAQAQIKAPGARMPVLVVDNNDVNRLVAEGMLTKLGCQVDLAEDGIAGVRACLAKRYALVFMDCQMPRMDGYEATRAIRGHEAKTGAPRTPITALTALALASDRERGMAAGMDDYLTKPVHESDMAAALERWTSWRRSGSPTTPPTPVAAAPPAPRPADEPPIIDLATVANLRALPDRLAVELWTTFADELPSRIAEIAATVAAGNVAVAERQMHALKGAAGTLGLLRLHRALERADLAARAAKPDWQKPWSEVPSIAEASRLATLETARTTP